MRQLTQNVNPCWQVNGGTFFTEYAPLLAVHDSNFTNTKAAAPSKTSHGGAIFAVDASVVVVNCERLDIARPASGWHPAAPLTVPRANAAVAVGKCAHRGRLRWPLVVCVEQFNNVQ